MKYTSTIKSRQFIVSEQGKKIFIVPGEGEMSEAEAVTVAKSLWGKRLIEAGSLTFEKTIEVKDEKVEHGMTIPKEKEKPSEESSGNGKEGDAPADENTEGEGGDQTPEGDDTEVDELIPDFESNAEGSGEE